MENVIDTGRSVSRGLWLGEAVGVAIVGSALTVNGSKALYWIVLVDGSIQTCNCHWYFPVVLKEQTTGGLVEVVPEAMKSV